jgi:hypothetical protein
MKAVLDRCRLADVPHPGQGAAAMGARLLGRLSQVV